MVKTFLNSFLIVFALILLVETTKFHDLLKGISRLGVPHIFLLLLSFIYRYFFVLIDEAERMLRAAKLRTFRKLSLKTMGKILGVLFIRSYERSERIYYAMCSRGFDGDIKTFKSDKSIL